MSGDWLTTEDLVAMFQVRRGTIYGWRMRGDAPPAYKVGKRLMWRREDVAAWLESHREGGDR
jgi:predicted DNA-binding transcriptional regulator AlpA